MLSVLQDQSHYDRVPLFMEGVTRKVLLLEDERLRYPMRIRRRKEQHAMRSPPPLSRQVIEELVEEYMREVNRIRRAGLREAVIHVRQEEGVPVPMGEEMEAHIDVLEALFDADLDDPDKILQFLDEMYNPPVRMPVSARSHNGKKRKGNRRRKIR